MRKLHLIFAFSAFAATAGANNISGVDTLPLDSIKPLKMKMAGKSAKAIDTKTKEEIKNEETKEVKKPTALHNPMKTPANTAKEQTAEQTTEHTVEQTETPIKMWQVHEGTLRAPKAEEMPTYPGGERALREFIRSNRNYPQECKAQRLSGKVTVAITIAPNGIPVNMEIISSSGNEAMDAEAMRVAKLMPEWTPAKDIKNGRERIYDMKFTFRPGR